MPGYFGNGTVNVELGHHVFGTHSGLRRGVTLTPHDAPAVLMESGGGVLEMTVTGQRLRANLGDAERYIYEMLAALATTDPGDLAFQDGRSFSSVYEDSVCVGGEGGVEGYAFAHVETDWLCPETSAAGEGAWAGAPAAPATYAGTSTLQDYQAGGIALGDGGSMRIELQRSGALREIPRARGSRATVPHSGAHVRFVITCTRIAPSSHLAEDLRDVLRSIGPGPVDLTGNGNTFPDVLLDRVRPTHTDMRYTEVEWTFLKEL